jgi:hypothetical protein
MQFQNEISINCPYCGETLLILIDDSGGEQSYYEDCSVCCAPMLITVTEDNYGNLHTEAKRDDE